MSRNAYALFEKIHFWKWGGREKFIWNGGARDDHPKWGGVPKCRRKWGGDSCAVEGRAKKGTPLSLFLAPSLMSTFVLLYFVLTVHTNFHAKFGVPSL